MTGGRNFYVFLNMEDITVLNLSTNELNGVKGAPFQTEFKDRWIRSHRCNLPGRFDTWVVALDFLEH